MSEYLKSAVTKGNKYESDINPVYANFARQYGAAIGDVQVISANIPTEARGIPVATSTFEYAKIERSQDLIEEEFLIGLFSRLPREIKVVQIADRRYGKSILLKNRLKRKELFIIRKRRYSNQSNKTPSLWMICRGS